MGLGTLSYMTWFETFNLSQLGVLIFAIVEGLVEHRMWIAGREAECLRLNRISSVAILLLAYPMLTGGMLLLGIRSYAAAAFVLVGGLGTVAVSAAALFVSGMRRATKLQASTPSPSLRPTHLPPACRLPTAASPPPSSLLPRTR